MKIKEIGFEKEKTEGRTYSSVNDYENETNWPRSRLISELRGLDGIIERFHKENEKTSLENKRLIAELKEAQDLLYKEAKKVEDYKHKVLKETGSVMVVEEELNMQAMNDLGVKHTIDQKQLDELKQAVLNAQQKAKDLDREATVRDV